MTPELEKVDRIMRSGITIGAGGGALAGLGTTAVNVVRAVQHAAPGSRGGAAAAALGVGLGLTAFFGVLGGALGALGGAVTVTAIVPPAGEG